MVRQVSWCKNASLVRFPACNPLLDHSTFDVELYFSIRSKDTTASDSEFIAQNVLNDSIEVAMNVKMSLALSIPKQ